MKDRVIRIIAEELRRASLDYAEDTPGDVISMVNNRLGEMAHSITGRIQAECHGKETQWLPIVGLIVLGTVAVAGLLAAAFVN